LPTLVLLDFERALVQTLFGRMGETDWIVPGRDGCKVQASQSRQECRAFQEVSATHAVISFMVRMVNSDLHVNQLKV
jgi:hypothetical protein